MTQVPLRTRETTLPVEECLRRLNDVVDEAPRSSFDWSRPYRGRDYAGRISEHDICIFRRASNLGSFRLMLLGSLTRSGGKTILRYRISLSPTAARAVALWLGAVAFFLLVLIAILQFGSASSAADRGTLLESIAICCGFGVMATAVLLTVRLTTPSEGALLERLVSQALATEAGRNAA